MAKVILPVRSREFGIGKEMVGSVYLHRDYEDRLGQCVVLAKRHIVADFDYTVVKFNRKTRSVSFIESPDFDTSPEPIVGDLWTIAADGSAKLRRRLADPYIYHHKWLMVAEDYTGFDVAQSRDRSCCWMSIDGVDTTRIGRLRFWSSSMSNVYFE